MDEQDVEESLQVSGEGLANDDLQELTKQSIKEHEIVILKTMQQKNLQPIFLEKV